MILCLLELESNPGGTARGGSRNGFKFPWGAHYIPVPMPENQALIKLLTEMQVIETCDRRWASCGIGTVSLS